MKKIKIPSNQLCLEHLCANYQRVLFDPTSAYPHLTWNLSTYENTHTKFFFVFFVMGFVGRKTSVITMKSTRRYCHNILLQRCALLLSSYQH